ncbi:MAG: SDR family NAD(P)-dependent oxidoreductase, partial [Spirochaetales bacterium]|nr:SDR family NAD(P)-dependent oxidoreductase [Spirochaetales bacterium]
MGVLSGKTAVVTGGTSGIGLAIVELFAHEDAVVLFVGRNTKHGEAIEGRLNGSRPTESAPTVRFYPCDVSDARQIDTTIRAMKDDYPVVDILVNNAGANLKAGTVRDVDVGDFNATIATNLTSYVLFARGFVPAMEERKNGAVVNIASTMGLRGASGHLSYTVTKGAN